MKWKRWWGFMVSTVAGALACTMLFQADLGPPSYHVLAMTDGTPKGTSIVKDIDGRDSQGFPVHYLTPVGDEVVFVAGNYKYGWELYRTNGTTAGTRIVKDFVKGEDGALWRDIRGDRLPVVGDKVYLGNLDKGGLLVYDSTTKNLSHLRMKEFGDKSRGDKVTAGPIVQGVNGNRLILEVGLGHAGFPSIQTWDTETRLSEEIAQTGSGYGMWDFFSISRKKFLMQFEHYLYTDGVLVSSDGTWDGSDQIGEIDLARGFTKALGKIYFSGETEARGNELWFTDATESGTGSIDLAFGGGSSSPRELTPFGEGLLFSADTNSKGRQVWRTDGTRKGTKVLTEKALGGKIRDPRQLLAVGKTLYFIADVGSFQSDQNRMFSLVLRDDGTARVAEIGPAKKKISADRLFRLGKKVLFEGSFGLDSGLFVLDGDGKNPVHLMTLGDKVFGYYSFNSVLSIGDCGRS